MQIDIEAAKWYLFSIEMCMRMCKPYSFVNITVANTNNLPQKLFTIILFSQHCEDTFSHDSPVLSPFRDFPTCPWPRSPRPSVPAPLMPQYQSTDHTFFLIFTSTSIHTLMHRTDLHRQRHYSLIPDVSSNHTCNKLLSESS